MMFNDTAILFPFGLFKGKFNPFLPPSTVLAFDEEVADANARLSINPTGKVAGYKVKQTDNSTIYTFNGDGADADAGLVFNGIPYVANGTSNGKNYYNNVGLANDPASNAVVYNGANWAHVGEFGGADESGTDANYPWLSTWDVHTATRNPIASLNNWTP